nr:unnamed protein product [Callosobruchus analis]
MKRRFQLPGVQYGEGLRNAVTSLWMLIWDTSIMGKLKDHIF